MTIQHNFKLNSQIILLDLDLIDLKNNQLKIKKIQKNILITKS